MMRVLVFVTMCVLCASWRRYGSGGDEEAGAGPAAGEARQPASLSF